MSRKFSFVELINLAIGTPELGNVNFNALHLFLHSLVDSLHLQDVRKEVSPDELEFIKPPQSLLVSAATSAIETLPEGEKPGSIFHQMQDRVTAIEKQLRFLSEPPDTAELLARSQGMGMGQPALDMWQMMQLKRKMELNEEGMTKAMNTLQDLLNSICSLKIATEGFQQELGQLKQDVAQINGEEMKERLMSLDKQARMMEEMKAQLGFVKERVRLSASASASVCWSALCETLTGKTFEEEEGDKEEEEWSRDKEEWSREEADRRREEADRRREEADRRREEADRRREEAGRTREEADRRREEADRRSAEAGRSREEADRSREEADGSREEADKSREEADRLREEAGRSREEADRSREEEKWSREEADRSREEEKWSREEADRRREEEKWSREEADRSKEEADRSREEADRRREEEKWSREEADRSKEEADRSREEADSREEASKRREEASRRREEASRRREEASRRREEASKRREEAGSSREEADRSIEEADRSQEEADRSREEAERSREEAERSREEAGRRREEAGRRREEADRRREEADRGREKTSREILAVLSQLPEKHEALQKHVTQLEAKLKYPAGPAAFEMPPELKSLLERMEILQTQSLQGKESLQETLEQMEKLREQYENLQQGLEKLSRSSMEMQIIRNLLHQLDAKKADKDSIQEEMNVKADKSALEAMVNHGQLQLATGQLSEMMQDLLQKMSLQDKDWQKALEKLFVDMDCKLDRLALDPVSRQLEEVWKFIKKYLSEGPRFDADSAAGFKKQLFERVKCISCDRPVTMMTGPHMITVRKATLRPRPVTAGGYEYLFHQQKRDQDPNEMSGNPPLQTCWQCQAQQQACGLKHLNRAQDFATLYPYGDPTAITYDNTEVDILGVNGVLYKGRVNSHAAERTFALQKEFAALKIPRPPTGVRMERVRSAFADINTVPYPSTTLRRVGSAITATSNQRPQQLSCDPVDRRVMNAVLGESHVQNERDIPDL